MNKYKYVSLMFLLFLGTVVNAKNIDSLKKLIAATGKEGEKAELYYDAGVAYKPDNTDSAHLYLARALRLAQKTQNSAIEYKAAVELGNVYYDNNNGDSAMAYYKAAFRYASNMKDLRNTGRAAYLISSDYFLLGDSYFSINYGDTALEISREIHDSDLLSKAYDILSTSYSELEDFTSALDILNQSIALNETRKNYSLLGRDYMLSANILDLQKEYDESLKYHEEAKEILAKSDDSIGRDQNEVNTAIVYREMGNYQRAISIMESVLSKMKQHDISWTEVCINLGIAQSKSGDYAAAEKNFLAIDKALHEGLNNPFMESSNDAELGDMYLRMKLYDKALVYAKKNEQLFGTDKLPIEDKKDAMLLLSDIYAAKGNMGEAYDYHKKYADLSDTIALSRQTKNYAQAEAKFNLAGRDKTIKSLSKENELEKTLNRKDRIIGISLLIIIILSLLFILIVISAYKRVLAKNRLLSEQKQIINEQVKQLETAATMKSKFLANISHELRMPVTLLTGMLKLMRDRERMPDQKEKERLDIAYNNSRKLQHMIEEILDLTKLQNNGAEAIFEIKEIAPFLKRIVYSFETLIEKEKLQLEFVDTGAKGIYVSIDADKFEKIINNLIYNAIKFNYAGGWIKVDAHPDPAADNQVVIVVSDSGSGITDEDLPHIFEHFYQGGSSAAKANGTGIGLSLVKEFTVLMGGNIAVKSIAGQGVTFSLTFATVAQPALINEAQTAEAKEDILPKEAWEHFATRQTVLIAEDNAEMRYYLKEILGEKVDIAETANGIEALKWMENRLPDLIISDVMMPGMDGRELISQLKSAERYKRIPIITLTALADTENQLSFLRMGVDDYIVKPFNADELRIRVYNLLTNQAARKEFNAQPAEPDDVPQNSKEAETFRETITKYVLARLKNANVSVYDLAYELSLSERQLYRLSKNLTGCTPAQLIKEVRLQKAYELLHSGDIYKIDDVAKRVGFEKASYFSQQFLERFGKRPTEFL